MTKRVIDDRCKTIGQNIKRFREKKGWTQEELAEKTDIHVSYIGQIERGLRYPFMKVLFKMEDVVPKIIEEGIFHEKSVKGRSNKGIN